MSRLAEWFTRFREPAVWAQARATPLHRCWLSREPVPDAIGLLLDRPGTLEGLHEVFAACGLPDPYVAAKARDALDSLRRAEEEAMLSHTLLAMEEMLRVLADALAVHPVPGCEGLLWTLLSRQERVGCLGRTEAARVDDIVLALARAYDGHEAWLVDSVGTQFLDPETAFVLLTAVERQRPGCARAMLVARLEDAGADRPFELQIVAALDALAGSPPDDALSELSFPHESGHRIMQPEARPALG